MFPNSQGFYVDRMQRYLEKHRKLKCETEDVHKVKRHTSMLERQCPLGEERTSSGHLVMDHCPERCCPDGECSPDPSGLLSEEHNYVNQCHSGCRRPHYQDRNQQLKHSCKIYTSYLTYFSYRVRFNGRR